MKAENGIVRTEIDGILRSAVAAVRASTALETMKLTHDHPIKDS